MAKVLKITKPDKTVHVIPFTNQTFYKTYNNRVPSSMQVKVEEIDESEAKHLEYIDENYITGIEAAEKLSEKDKEIAELRVLLEQANASIKVSHETGTKQTVAPNLNHKDAFHTPAPTPDLAGKTAVEVIALIDAAATAEQVNNLSKGDERKTVQDAAAKKLEAFKSL